MHKSGILTADDNLFLKEEPRGDAAMSIRFAKESHMTARVKTTVSTSH